jgi:DNA (cytosine-5)-methyltransferase 1
MQSRYSTVAVIDARLTALEFFAGSGLVRAGLAPDFETVWANDICPKKAAVYAANASHPLHLESIEHVAGAPLPAVDLAWASFPCQDLSLAGNLTGIRKGTRSGLFWEWLRVIDELAAVGRRPPLLVAENVVGFLVAHQGVHFRRAYAALKARGYLAGALVMDTRHFLPQSRPRAFIIAVDQNLPVHDYAQIGPSLPFQPDLLIRAARYVNDSDWLWWSVPAPSGHVPTFADLCDRDAPHESTAKTAELRAMLSPANQRKLERALKTGAFVAGTGYRRTRPNARGRKVQRLEIRFDGVAGCLRTPEGGSSRQVVVIVEKGRVRTRLMTVRECARLMGAPDTFQIPGSYNDGYRAMGDAVALPVVRWLTRHLLTPLAVRHRAGRSAESAA